MAILARLPPGALKRKHGDTVTPNPNQDNHAGAHSKIEPPVDQAALDAARDVSWNAKFKELMSGRPGDTARDPAWIVKTERLKEEMVRYQWHEAMKRFDPLAKDFKKVSQKSKDN